MNIPYTYLIGWSELNVYYYGVRYAQDCHPNDLWQTYFTSSEHVENFVREHGAPDIREVRHTFCQEDRISKARLWETKVLKKMKVVEKDNWLNKHDSPSPPINRRYGDDNVMKRPELREAMRGDNNPARKPGVGQKISTKLKGRAPTFKDKTHTNETKNLMKQRWEERKNSGWVAPARTKEQCEAVSKKLKGRTPDPAVVAKMKNTLNTNGTRKGSKNPAAKPLLLRGIQYGCIRDASAATGLSVYKILKECEFVKK